MSDTTYYVLENIEQTTQISDAIYDMKKSVYVSFDNAVRESINEWFGDAWECYAENLYDDKNIHILHRDFKYGEKSRDGEAMFYICLSLDGKDEQIWDFLSTPSRHNSDTRITVQLYFDDAISDDLVMKVFEYIDTDELNLKGFAKRAKKRFWLEKNISFDSKAILAGLKDNEWDEVLQPLKNDWAVLVNLDWSRLLKIIK